MMVTFVSQCEKKALNRTRRVLDSFANRIGDNAWQTVITNEGLGAVKKLLRKTASKNTAVSCHWIRSRARSELVWVVGNRDKFNSEGVVPVNSTGKEILMDEKHRHNTEVISLLAGIAGLFHDFGKANKLFQDKLKPKHKGKKYEPYRHEWVSLRLFQAFVGEQNKEQNDKERDEKWLNTLADVTKQDDTRIIERLIKDDTSNTDSNPFKELPPLAKLVAWLIVSHHRLPVYPVDKTDNPPEYEYINQWMEANFDSLWNSPSSFDDNWDEKVRADNWEFPDGTPLLSAIWQNKATELANKALKCQRLLEQDWFEQRFTARLSRLVLMLSDHYYSSRPATLGWQDRSYECYANTDGNRKGKQKLDEHNVGVGENAVELAKKLPALKGDLPTIKSNQNFTKNKSDKDQYKWQDKAYKLAKSLQETSTSYGFFGINMASTGFGKTLANARIMYALADEDTGCRFSVALGLRTLTLQTGDKLVEDLDLKKDQYAVLIGSQAVQQLHDKNKVDLEKEQENNFNTFNGSDSQDDPGDEGVQIVYGGIPNNEILTTWLEKSSKLQKLIDAPLLVSTIDHLIPATEGIRGGKQIAPMLRLLTSDLVLDEPDDFGLEDLPALCRLVNWAGMLGSRVLLSTATMPPALAYALFQSYQTGWRDYTAVNGEKGETSNVCCAWFDEFGVSNADINNIQVFKEKHTVFVDKRIKKLTKDAHILRKASLLQVSCKNEADVLTAMSSTIHQAIQKLHQSHNQLHESGKHVSIGLVRMANINPLVAVAKKLFSISPLSDHRIHYCVYHSQYPLAIRSHIEKKLDASLTRHNEVVIWEQPEIKQAIEQQPEKHHIFVVLATSVAEVGRDHDYDWVIAEPSSMRSLIQVAGRIQRHRGEEPEPDNLLILSKNFKALKEHDETSPAYCRPGFERKRRMFANHDLEQLLKPASYKEMNAVPRIQRPEKPTFKDGKYTDFVQLEQFSLYQKLLGEMKEDDNAKHWWSKQPTWCAELQRRQPFRRTAPDSVYCRFYNESAGQLLWKQKNEPVKPAVYKEVSNISWQDINVIDRNQHWFYLDTKTIYTDLSKQLNLDLNTVSYRFGEMRLRKDNNKVIDWYYHPNLGVFNEI